MRLVSVGDNVVDRYPQRGWMYPGGNCVNVAVAVSRAGHHSSYVGAIGTDSAGELIRSALEIEGVHIDRLRTVEGPTATTNVTLVNGDRTFTDSQKGVSMFRPDEGDLVFIGSHELAHVSYCSGLEGDIESIARRARLSFDFDNRTAVSYAKPILEHAFVAEFSAGGLTDDETEDLVRWAHDLGPTWVLATRGSEPAVLYDGVRIYRQPAPDVEIVDTLGAGDAFIARLLIGIARDEHPDEMLVAAADAGAEACTQHGGFGHGRRIDEPSTADTTFSTNQPTSNTERH